MRNIPFGFPKRKRAREIKMAIVVSDLVVESIEFSANVKPPASSKTHFLASAGVRGLDMEGEFVKFSVIGVYLEPDAVEHLSGKWKGKTPDELFASLDFYRDVVTCPFEKFMRVTIIRLLTGAEFSKKVMENCVAYMKSVETYTDAEAKAVDNVLEVFKEETFSPGASILWTQLPNGTLAITFSKDWWIPKTEKVVIIENKQLSEAVLETMIGKHGVSPATKLSMAARLPQLF